MIHQAIHAPALPAELLMTLSTQALSSSASPLATYLDTLPREPVPGRELWRDARGQVQGQYFNCSLTSAFEPLVTLAAREVVAHEGSIRTYAEDGVGLAAGSCSRWRRTMPRWSRWTACRGWCTRINYFRARPGGGPPSSLCLNVHNRLLAAVADDHGAALRPRAGVAGDCRSTVS